MVSHFYETGLEARICRFDVFNGKREEEVEGGSTNGNFESIDDFTCFAFDEVGDLFFLAGTKLGSLHFGSRGRRNSVKKTHAERVGSGVSLKDEVAAWSRNRKCAGCFYIAE